MPDRPWYTVIAATILALAFAGAAFWLIAYTEVESGTAFGFLSPALLLVGYITGQAVPAGVATILSRATVERPAVTSEPPPAPQMKPPRPPRGDDGRFIAEDQTPHH